MFKTDKVPMIKSFWRILQLTWCAHPTAVFIISILTLVQGLLPAVSAWITKYIFDLLTQSFTGVPNTNWMVLTWILIAYTFIAILDKVLAPVHTYLNAELGRRLTVTIQQTVYKKINSFAGIAYFENPELYDALRLAQQGAQNSSSQILSTLTSLVRNIVTLTSFLGVLLVFSPLLVVLVIIATLPELYTQLKFSRQRFHLSHEISADQRQQFFYGFILSTPPPAKEVRLFNLGGYLLDKVLTHFRQVHTAQRKQQQYEMRWQLGLGVLSSLVTSVTFIIVIVQAFQDSITVGDIALYVSAITAVQAALISLMFSAGSINESILFYSYFNNLLALPEPLTLAENPLPAKPLGASIELRQVSFRYSEDHPWILKDVNLVLPAGQCLALVGLNGAGKTTLVKLLTRMYDPTEGQILWDGIDIREFDPAVYRERLGVVFQDFMRYDLTVQENIGLGDVNRLRDLERVKRAAMKTGIHKKIEQLPQGYQTQLSLMFGDGAPTVDLSGGEWQKMAMARMFMRDADLLILDEPTSALDAQAEHEIHQNFVELVSDRTSVLISHRFSTVRMADVIAVLENGHIVELGTHEQLLQQEGTYARLYRMQVEKYTNQVPAAANGHPPHVKNYASPSGLQS